MKEYDTSRTWKYQQISAKGCAFSSLIFWLRVSVVVIRARSVDEGGGDEGDEGDGDGDGVECHPRKTTVRTAGWPSNDKVAS